MRTDPRGLSGPTPKQARGPHWRRTSQGFYVPSEVDGTVPEQRIVEAAVVVPRYGGVTGWAALRWHGGLWFDGLGTDGRSPQPVWLATCTADIRRQSGIEISSEGLRPDEWTVVDGLAVTTAIRSVLFEMRYAPHVREAVKFADMAAYDDLVSIAELAEAASHLQGWTGIPQVRDALPLLDENVWSPREAGMRMTWVLDAGLPRPLCNVPIFDRRGNHVGTPDLLDPEAGVVGEYDGALHLEGAQRARDVRREELFRRHGLEYFTMLAGDVGDRTGLVDRMIATRRRAKWLPESQRPWTITPPGWWTETRTVAQRRALDEGQRARFLALRRQAS